MLVPVLKDSGQLSSTFGQLIIAAASIADFGAIILLTIFFSGEGGTGSTLLLLGALFLLAATVLLAVRGAEHSMRIRADLLRLQDTMPDPRARDARPAGRVRRAGGDARARGDPRRVHRRHDRLARRPRRGDDPPGLPPQARAVGFGFFVPAFFVTSGVRFDLDALTASASSLLMVPIFVLALLAARGLPAIVYRGVLDARHTAIAGLMLATIAGRSSSPRPRSAWSSA